jgi:Mg2+/citrate symporter
MYLVPIAWLYVATMMAVAEATSDVGTLLGAIVTFVLYGLLPVVLLVYIMGTPGRKRQIKAREAAMNAQVEIDGELPAREAVAQGVVAPALVDPDAGGHAPTAAQSNTVPPVRKET